MEILGRVEGLLCASPEFTMDICVRHHIMKINGIKISLVALLRPFDCNGYWMVPPFNLKSRFLSQHTPVLCSELSNANLYIYMIFDVHQSWAIAVLGWRQVPCQAQNGQLRAFAVGPFSPNSDLLQESSWPISPCWTTGRQAADAVLCQ